MQEKDKLIFLKNFGTIDTNVPLEEEIEDLKRNEWDDKKVFELFKKLRFNKYIDRFGLRKEEDEEKVNPLNEFETICDLSDNDLKKLTQQIEENKQFIYYINTKEVDNAESIIKKEIISISIITQDKIYYIEGKDIIQKYLGDIFENDKIKKIGYKLKQDYILLKQIGIEFKNFYYDVEIAGYIIDSIKNKYDIETLSLRYLNIELSRFIKNEDEEPKQLDLFSSVAENEERVLQEKNKSCIYVIAINKLYEVTNKMIRSQKCLKVFSDIDMKAADVLAKMQYTGIGVDKKELIEIGRKLKLEIDEKKEKIYQLCGQEFNINSTKQLGKVLFEDLKLPVQKKKKSGYSTDVEVLEKLRGEHPVIEELLAYRQIMKLNSTFVEGLLPYINEKTNRIHSYFHQTVTATGRISSAEPNLQNIPTRFESGKNLRKVFKPKEGCIFIDADYSQIELRVFAHIAQDDNMIQAFKDGNDIHSEVASKVFEKPLDEVTKKERTKAKAVNFGIVYGISDFGLGEQLNIDKKEAKEYIVQYFEKYPKIKEYMEKIDEIAKEQGYVSTIFGRRRYIPELKSESFLVRQFGSRAALNMPIQGTAADIMKLAMIEVNKKIEEKGLKSRLVLQVHDELLLEVPIEEKEEAIKLLKDSMENIIELSLPLVAEVTSADSWYGCK